MPKPCSGGFKLCAHTTISYFELKIEIMQGTSHFVCPTFIKWVVYFPVQRFNIFRVTCMLTIFSEDEKNFIAKRQHTTVKLITQLSHYTNLRSQSRCQELDHV